MACLLSTNCGKGQSISSDERQRIDEVVSSFVLEAYGPGGDVDVAYGLLSEESQDSCPKSDFSQMATVGRQLLVGHRPVVQTDDLHVSNDTARLKIEISIGNFVTHFFPEEMTLSKEGGEWHYVITTDPSCKSVVTFFDLRDRPGIVVGQEVTPVSEGNPSCDPSYPTECIPSPPPILSCLDIGSRDFIVWPPDPHGFDPDHNGFGCDN
jgi:hypothetical protein